VANTQSVAAALRGREGIYVKNLNRVLVNLQQIGPRTEKRATLAINQTLRRILVKARADAPRDTGHLLGNLLPRMATKSKRGVIRGYVRSDADYAAWVEFGTWKQTRKRKKAKMPNVKPGSPLYLWAVRHGIKPFVLARSMAAAVQTGRLANAWGRVIGRQRARSEGVKKRPYLGPAFVSERANFYRRMLDILDVPRAANG